VIAASRQPDSVLSAARDSMVVCAATAIGRSIFPAVFSSSPNPEVTPPLQPSNERQSRESVLGRGGVFRSDPSSFPNLIFLSFSHDHRTQHVIVALVSTSHLEFTAAEQSKTNPRAIEQLIKMVSPTTLPMDIISH
jgi:hypothetical protein